MKVKVRNSSCKDSTNQYTRVLRGRVVKYAGSQKENVPRKTPPPAEAISQGRSSSSVISKAKPKLCRRDFSNLVEIGRGGFSVVYRAFMKARHLTCVLKFLNHAKILKLNAKLDDIALERSLFQRMDHINIPKLLGFFETTATTVFVLEFCDKGDLYDYIHKTSSVQVFPRNCIRNKNYTRQLVTAVEYFQKTTKYIHMDIKPENILVTSNDTIKLTDFGCCVPMKSPRYVHTKHNGGTKPYRPPELLHPRKPEFDSTADVWGIGCVAFQMMAPSGEHPFFHRNPATNALSNDVGTALARMIDFKNGIYTTGNFDRMDEDCKTFLRQTIGTDRERRPLVSRLLESAFLTTTARVFSPCF